MNTITGNAKAKIHELKNAQGNLKFTNNLISGLVCWGFLMTLLSMYLGFRSTCPYVWHGGSPSFKGGSCWCGKDGYCLCTPSLAIDAIIEVRNTNIPQIVLVKRRDPPKDKFAIPGGFVDVGESVEVCVIREVEEETNLKLKLSDIEQFHVYSDPARDKRRHTVSSVFRCLVDVSDLVDLKKGDDAMSVVVMSLKDFASLPLAFDHKDILRDYVSKYHPTLLP